VADVADCPLQRLSAIVIKNIIIIISNFALTLILSGGQLNCPVLKPLLSICEFTEKKMNLAFFNVTGDECKMHYFINIVMTGYCYVSSASLIVYSAVNIMEIFILSTDSFETRI